MKRIIFRIAYFINKIIIRLRIRDLDLRGSSFYKFRCDILSSNKFISHDANFHHVRISVTGSGNTAQFTSASVSSSTIQVSGKNNKLILEPGVNLRGSTIHLRGENSTIVIGERTTFGGARLVNVGYGNKLEIGRGCLFADHIEVWASDTHSILDLNGDIINKEKPIQIGDRVWIGSHVTILKGVTIGNDSVIGMGAMVTKDISAGTLNVGNPSRCVKEGIRWSLDY